MPVATRRQFFRLNPRRYPDPAFFSRGALHRFDAPGGSFGVCYLGTTLDCCLLEVLLPRRHPGTTARVLTLAQLRHYYVAICTVIQPLLLAHLADDGLAQAGIDQRITGGDDYDLSQAWAAAIHTHDVNVDGIFYPSRHHNGLYSVALFERVRNKVAFDRWGPLGDRRHRGLWSETGRVLQRFGIGVTR
jgi:hypothetical protein